MIEQDYISYLETKVLDQDNRIQELEATLMIIVFNEVNQVNKDFMYLRASTELYKSMPFSKEVIKKYKALLDVNGA